jgi:transposase
VNHIAIDLGSRKSQVCIRSETGAIVSESRLDTSGIVPFLGGLEPSHVVMETCSESFAIAVRARDAGHRCSVVAATRVRAIGVGARGIKTDIRDARALSEAAWRGLLPTVHIPSERSRMLRRMLSTREGLTGTRTRLINATRGYLRTQLLGIPKKASKSFTQAVRTLFVMMEHTPPPCIVRQLELLDVVDAQLALANAECATAAKADPLCVRLMTIPAIGPLSALNFVAAIDDVSRFSNAHAVECYLGLTPGESSSGDKTRRTRITKAGCSRVRKCLTQAAWSVYRAKGLTPHSAWMHRLAAKRGTKIAIVATARRLAGVMYALWRDGRDYDASVIASNSSHVERVM